MAEKSTKIRRVAESIGGLAKLSKPAEPKGLDSLQGVAPMLLALSEFDACVRYLNTRRSEGAIINIQDEAGVQDVLYLLLRPWITDLTYESPGEKSANRFVIKDFSSARQRFVVDAKYVRNKEHGKSISKELHDDIEMYRSHARCDYLVFFVYDPDGFIPDQRALKESIEIERHYGSDDGLKKLTCRLIVKP